MINHINYINDIIINHSNTNKNLIYIYIFKYKYKYINLNFSVCRNWFKWLFIRLWFK